MSNEEAVSNHYNQDDLTAAIEGALQKLGKTPADVTEEDLAPVGEFHVGGRLATAHLLDRASFDTGSTVLDVGCGVGGPARLLAGRVSSVVGIDLTEVYVATGNTLNDWVGLQDRVDLQHGSALAMPFADDSFDGAVMLHVGMNITAKDQLFAEVGRVLRPGARFAVYDIMRTGDDAVDFPMPWATDPANSSLATLDDYRNSATAAGFQIVSEENRQTFATEFFARLRSAGPSPLGLQLLMGSTAGTKIGNLASAIASGTLAPVQLIAQLDES